MGGVLLGLLLAIPALAIILPLLVRSDAAFEGLIGRSVLANAAELIPTVLFGLMLFLPAYARPVALIHDDPEPSPAKPGRFPPVTLHTFLGAVSFVYLLYLFSQLAYFFSAFRGILPEGYTQAEYARRGFFEMCALCSINLLMVIIAIGQVRREPKTPWLTKALCLFILVFSLVLAVCSASKMGMYIGAYGLTRLRVLTSVFMVCVAVALVCVAIWILAPRFPTCKLSCWPCWQWVASPVGWTWTPRSPGTMWTLTYPASSPPWMWTTWAACLREQSHSLPVFWRPQIPKFKRKPGLPWQTCYGSTTG